ncbi:MAG: hypothetical protein LBB13_00745, partial [Rickettsiales bacterium]|nr:hypothetical protein [Rickettsiales bacterium]
MAALVINGSQDGMRIDRLLISEFRDSNILDIWKFIRNKEIRVNGRAVVQNYRVKCQDVVSYSNFVEKIMKSPLIRKSSRGVGIRKHNFTNLNTHSGIGLVTNNIIY